MQRVEAAFFSFTPVSGDGDAGYLRWHLLDHMPEQYQLPGLVHGARWMADADLRSARIAGEGPLDDTGSVVNYLVGDPVQQTHDEFFQLGRRLTEMGRFPERRPSIELDFLALLNCGAAPSAFVSAEVVPFRPHRGVMLIVETPADGDVGAWLRWLHSEHHPEVLQTAGVAGVWMYGATGRWLPHATLETEPRFVTVVYLDEDPLATTDALRATVGSRWSSGAVRPLFAGPLRSMVHWDAWPP